MGLRAGNGRRRQAARRSVGALLAATLLTGGLAACSGDSGSEPTPSPSASQSPEVLGPTPVPEVTGTLRNGETLTGHAGSWGPGEVTVSYRWLRDDAEIEGALEDTYALTRDDVGHQITLRVTGSKSGFEDVVQESSPVGPILRAVMRSHQPEITGEAVFGARLGVGDLDWGSEDVRFRYQWLRDGTAVAGATGSTYRLTTADLGRRLSVQVTGRLPGFDPAVELSAQTGSVRNAAFTVGDRPALDGVPRYYEWLTVAAPAWRPRPETVSYQWFRDGVPMSGITSASYQLHGRDIGHRIKVLVTGSREGFSTRQQFTRVVGPIREGRIDPAPRPTISGTAEVDAYLTASASGWGPAPVAFTWQWFRGDAPIRGAVDSSYRLTVDDLGQRISVRATGTSQFFEPRSQRSQPTGQVRPGALSPTPTPLFSGLAQVGETITALPREWGPGEVRLSYQWYRGNHPIRRATGVEYVPVPADLGHQLRVQVTGSRHGYRDASRRSGFTSEIGPGVLTPGAPSITGLAAEGDELTVDGGSWDPESVALTYQWYRGEVLITRATEATYVLSGADVGFPISVRVVGTKQGYTTAEAWTPVTEPVVARPR